MFSHEGEEYLKNQMNVCLTDLTEKILMDAPDCSDFFRSLIDYMLTLEAPLKYVDLHDRTNNKYFRCKLVDFSSKNNIYEGAEYSIFDSLCHAFICFKQYGLYELYKHREAEEWYPKIIIRSKIEHEKNKIENLPEEFPIYRGTSKDEFYSNNFGQSWTLDKDIANNFAVDPYKNPSHYKNTTRVILKVNFKRSDVYFFDENDSEKEVIIDERKLFIFSPKIIDETSNE